MLAPACDIPFSAFAFDYLLPIGILSSNIFVSLLDCTQNTSHIVYSCIFASGASLSLQFFDLIHPRLKHPHHRFMCAGALPNRRHDVLVHAALRHKIMHINLVEFGALAPQSAFSLIVQLEAHTR